MTSHSLKFGLALLFVAAPTLATTPIQPIAPGDRKAYCRGEVSGMYGTKPIYVTTGTLVRGKGATTSVSGTVDKGTEGIKKFMCKYDAKGRLVDVMAMTPDGE